MTLFFSIRVLTCTCKMLIQKLLGIQNPAWMAFTTIDCFSLFENISLIFGRHHCHQGLLNLGLYSAPMGFELEGIFIVQWNMASVYTVSSKEPLVESPHKTIQGYWRATEDLFLPTQNKTMCTRLLKNYFGLSAFSPLVRLEMFHHKILFFFFLL